MRSCSNQIGKDISPTAHGGTYGASGRGSTEGGRRAEGSVTGRAEVNFYHFILPWSIIFVAPSCGHVSNESALEAGKRGIIVGGWAELSEEPRSELV